MGVLDVVLRARPILKITLVRVKLPIDHKTCTVAVAKRSAIATFAAEGRSSAIVIASVGCSDCDYSDRPGVTRNNIGPSFGFDYGFFLPVQQLFLTWTDLICPARNTVRSLL